MAITTAMTTSFRQELLAGGHCFNAVTTATGTASSASTSMTAVSSLSNIAVGMTVTGTGIATNSVVATITSSAAFSLSLPTTAVISGGTLTFTADAFKMALFNGAPSGTYGVGTTNYTDMSAEEASGTGYTAGGFALTNVTPVGSSGVGYTTFNVNPSWTSATFTTAGCILYNTSVRNGGTSGTNTTGGGRAVAVWSFGAAYQASTSAFTIILPAASTTTALLRLS